MLKIYQRNEIITVIFHLSNSEGLGSGVAVFPLNLSAASSFLQLCLTLVH